MFALQFHADRLEHVAFVISSEQQGEVRESLLNTCASFDRRTTRVSVVATSPWPEGKELFKPFGCDWFELGSSYRRQGIVGRVRRLAKRLREIEAHELRWFGSAAPEWRIVSRLPVWWRPRTVVDDPLPRAVERDRVAIFLKSDLATDSANVGQALRTGASLVRAGATVRVVAPLSSGEFGAVLARCSIDAASVPGLDHRAIPRVTRTLHCYRTMSGVIEELADAGFGTLYFRQVRIASMLVERARQVGMRVWMEAHQPYTTWSLSQRHPRWIGALSKPELCRSLRATVRMDREFERDLYPALDGVACTTDAMCRHVDRVAGMEKAFLLRNGAPQAEEPLPASAREFDVIYSGRTHSNKGTDVLLKALARLGEVQAEVIGGPTDEDLAPYRRMATDLGVVSRVRFVSWLDRESLFERVRRARVAVHPIAGRESREWRLFTCPLKIVEAMALGTPVVSTDLPAIRELIEHDVNGVLVEPGSTTALAEAVDSLLRDPDRRSRLAEAARATIERLADGRRGAELYRRLVGASGESGPE